MDLNTINNKTINLNVGLDLTDLREAIQKEYEAVANEPDKGFHFHTGHKLANMLDYREMWLKDIPESAVNSFAGTGNPFSIKAISSGERVVDVGCGAGMDSFIAGKFVGQSGYVIGVDMTYAMNKKAKNALLNSNFNNVEFRKGFAEDLPVENNWADVVISNGVINLTPDKELTFREMFRILKPGGRLQVADIIVTKPVPVESKQKVELWTGCIAGGMEEDEMWNILNETGFIDISINGWNDIYAGAPQSSSAEYFGTYGVTILAYKPGL
jgi:arsenite methyltransferase